MIDIVKRGAVIFLFSVLLILMIGAAEAVTPASCTSYNTELTASCLCNSGDTSACQPGDLCIKMGLTASPVCERHSPAPPPFTPTVVVSESSNTRTLCSSPSCGCGPTLICLAGEYCEEVEEDGAFGYSCISSESTTQWLCQDTTCACGSLTCNQGQSCAEDTNSDGVTKYHCKEGNQNQDNQNNDNQNNSSDADNQNTDNQNNRTGRSRTPTTLAVTGTPTPEVVRPGSCEVHLGFNYNLPDDPAQWNLNNMLTGGAGPVHQFIDRVVALGQSRVIYVHGFTSYEGTQAVNTALAGRRADAMIRVMQEYIQSKNLPDISVNVRRGTMASKSTEFYNLTAAEKRAINRFPSTQPNRAARISAYQANQALAENRRAVLTLDTSDYSIVQLGGSGARFLDEGCPDTQLDICGDGVLDAAGNETCEVGIDYMCSETETCDATTCQCVPRNETPVPVGCVVDGIKSANESCDPRANPTGCEEDQTCKDDCTCDDGGCVIWGIPCWMFLLPLALLLFWFYRTRRTKSKKRNVLGDAGLISDKRKICIFLAALLEKKKQLIEDVRELEANISSANENTRKDFDNYLKGFRDVAYLRDRTSPESKMLDKAEEDVKDLFENYLGLIFDLLELEKLEATLETLLTKLTHGINELKKDDVSPILDELQVKLSKEDIEELETVIPKLHREAANIMSEVDKIEHTIEEHIYEMGTSLSGIVSMFGKGRWEKKFKDKYGKDGEDAFKELWWVKKELHKGMGFHSPVYLRGEQPPIKETLLRKILLHRPAGKWNLFRKKWADDKLVSTSGDEDPEEVKWKARASHYFDSPDIRAKSAFIQKIGLDIVENVKKDGHLLTNLFKIVSIDDESIVHGLERTGDVHGLSKEALFKKGLKYSGELQEEINSIVSLIKVLCTGRSKPLSVNIETPKDLKIKHSDIPALLENKDAFKAKITGGRPPYSFVWHWGPHTGRTDEQLSSHVNGNVPVCGKTGQLSMTPTGSQGNSVSIELKRGFPKTGERCRLAVNKSPFDNFFSINSEGNVYLLHVTVYDGSGQLAHDKISIETAHNNVIEGEVVHSDDHNVKIADAEVWLEHSEFPDGKVIKEYEENDNVVKVKTDSNGKFRIEGSFQYHISVLSKKDLPEEDNNSKAEGRSTDRGGHPPGAPFNMEGRKRNDVVVPLFFPAASPDFDWPEPIDGRLMENISKLADIVEGKAGVSGGIKNNVMQAMMQMKNEAKGLSLQKFAFGTKDSARRPDIRRIRSLVERLYGGTIPAVGLVIKMIAEKKELIENYIKTLKTFEEKIKKLAERAASEGDEEMFTLYERMQHNFLNIREYIEKHTLLDTLMLIDMELKELVDLKFTAGPVDMDDKNFVKVLNIGGTADLEKIKKQTDFRAKSKKDQIDLLICEIYRWKHSVSESFDHPGFLESDFEIIVKQIKEQTQTLHNELGQLVGVITENYHHFQTDLQAFNEISTRREEERRKSAGSERQNKAA